MKIGFRRNGAASCTVQTASGLPVHMRERTREIANLAVPPKHRAKGYATSLMHRVCWEADQAGIMLILTPKPYKLLKEIGDTGMDQEILERWYQDTFGFQVVQIEPRLFARMPGATPKVGLKLAPVTRAIVEAARRE